MNSYNTTELASGKYELAVEMVCYCTSKNHDFAMITGIQYGDVTSRHATVTYNNVIDKLAKVT